MLVAFYHKLTTNNKSLFLRFLTNHSPRGRECLFPGQSMPCHLGAAIPAVLPGMLYLWLALCSLCSPTQQTAQRAGQVNLLPSCIPGTIMGEESRSWEPKGAQFRWDDILQCGSGTGCSLWYPVAGKMGDSRTERPTSTEAHSTMSRHSDKGTVDQESVSAGEMALDTARGDQQQIMDKAHITEVQRSACLWVCEWWNTLALVPASFSRRWQVAVILISAFVPSSISIIKYLMLQFYLSLCFVLLSWDFSHMLHAPGMALLANWGSLYSSALQDPLLRCAQGSV